MSKQNPYYVRNGIEYDRVTSILGYFKDERYWKWVLKMGKSEADEIGRKAMAIGTNVDNAIRKHVEGKKVVKFKKLEERNCYEAYLQWRKDHQIKDIQSAETLFNDSQQVAGTPDLWLPDETCDIKCSTSIRPAYWLQVNWYAMQRGHKYRSILRLDKDLSYYEYKRLPVSEYHGQVFDALITAYRYYNKTV